jgi:hypothetical protein
MRWMEMKMWTLVLLWVMSGTLTAHSVPNFETKQACGNAFNTLKAEVSWGDGINLVGLCVSAK